MYQYYYRKGYYSSEYLIEIFRGVETYNFNTDLLSTLAPINAQIVAERDLWQFDQFEVDFDSDFGPFIASKDIWGSAFIMSEQNQRAIVEIERLLSNSSLFERKILQIMQSINLTISRLQYLCDTIPSLIKQIPEQEFSHKLAPNKWSKKEILGHLIDSATNNHQRFVRGQFEDTPFIVYDQDNWVACSRYQDMPGSHVITFWEAYHRHLLEVITRIPEESLSRKCKTNEPEPVTLLWLIEDYVKHQEHHLRQIVNY